MFHSSLLIQFVIFALSDKCLNLFLMKTKDEPLKSLWVLPEGILKEDEHLEAAVQRAYCDVAPFENIFLDQLQTFAYPPKPLEQQTVHVVYYAMINRNKFPVEAKPTSDNGKWFPVSNLPPLNLFHRKYYQIALKELQDKIRRQPIGFYQLPVEFELNALRHVYEMILCRNLDLNVFRTKIFEIDLLVPLKEKGTYRFSTKKYFDLKEKGFYLNI